VEALFYRGTARAIMETLLQQNPDLCGVIDAWDGQSVGTFPTVSHPAEFQRGTRTVSF